MTRWRAARRLQISQRCPPSRGLVLTGKPRTTPAAPCADLCLQLLFKGVNRRGVPTPDRHVKLLIQFALEEVLSGAYSHCTKRRLNPVPARPGNGR
jgi:hypothetical protein